MTCWVGRLLSAYLMPVDPGTLVAKSKVFVVSVPPRQRFIDDTSEDASSCSRSVEVG
jgi:hypothetical protein